MRNFPFAVFQFYISTIITDTMKEETSKAIYISILHKYDYNKPRDLKKNAMILFQFYISTIITLFLLRFLFLFYLFQFYISTIITKAIAVIQE